MNQEKRCPPTPSGLKDTIHKFHVTFFYRSLKVFPIPSICLVLLMELSHVSSKAPINMKKLTCDG